MLRILVGWPIVATIVYLTCVAFFGFLSGFTGAEFKPVGFIDTLLWVGLVDVSFRIDEAKQ